MLYSVCFDVFLDAYSAKEVIYEWDNKYVSFESGMALSQFDLLKTKCKNFSDELFVGGGKMPLRECYLFPI